MTHASSTTDIHDRKEREAALREMDRRKDEFLATLAHELRNPLAPIRNALEILKQDNGDAASIKSARTIMERQLSHMVRLIDDLMDAGRITHGRLDLHRSRVALAAVVDQAVETSRPLLIRGGHELIVSLPREPVFLDADAVRMAQVIGNLLNNASKYTPPGKSIRLTAVVERQAAGGGDGASVVIRVKDAGIGIPPDKLESIFEMFTQLDRSLERSQGGLGIGLTLVKRLVDMHGGTVRAFSHGTGHGAEFVVTLPVAAPSTRGSAPREAPIAAAEPASRRILVVDDNVDSARSLSRLLELSGHVTRMAHDGVEALELFEREAMDVVLLDIGLPRMNGYDVCRQIRTRAGGVQAVIVALTGWGQKEDRARSKEAGFDGHLVKPLDFDALTQLLARSQPAVR